MTKTVSVQAQLIPVGQKFTAEPGQQIMVVAGIAIGVYTGVPAIPVPQGEMATNPISTKGSTTSGAAYRRKSTTKYGKYTTDPVFKRIVDTAIALVRVEGELMPARLREVVGIAKTDKQIWKVRDTLAALCNDGTLTASGGTTSRSYVRGPTFPTEQSNGAEAA